MKKTDVYVVVDTPKKAKKLKKVLNMFGEKHFADVHLSDFEDCVGRAIHFWENRYFARSGIKRVENDKSKVSIKELRNILAKEHLKVGDVVVFDNDLKGKIVGFNGDSEIIVNDEDKDIVTCFIGDFLRYATEEEKALLEPKKELGVDKWYRGVWERPTSNFTDSDVAIVEQLHDTLLDNHGYSVESKLLKDVRMLVSKIKSKIK